MPACEGRLAQVGWPTVTPTLPTQPLGRTLPSRRPEQLDGTDQVGAVGFPDEVEHPLSSILSELLVQSARKRLLLGFAALQGSIGHGFCGTGAAQVGFGGCCRALHPLIPELFDAGGQRRRAWGQHLRCRGRRRWRISVGQRACKEGKRNNS